MDLPLNLEVSNVYHGLRLVLWQGLEFEMDVRESDYAAHREISADGWEFLPAASSLKRQQCLEWSGESELERDSRNAGASVVSTAFRMIRPAAGQTVFDGAASANGDFMIVGLTRVVDGTIAGEGQEQRDLATRSLEVEAGRASYDAVVQTLRSSAEVMIVRENL